MQHVERVLTNNGVELAKLLSRGAESPERESTSVQAVHGYAIEVRWPRCGRDDPDRVSARAERVRQVKQLQFQSAKARETPIRDERDAQCAVRRNH